MTQSGARTLMSPQDRRVIFASSLGTVFEWYDFYLYGALAGLIARHFFSDLDAGAAFIFALLAFAAGFIVRPFGALVFGRLGDLIGRKYTFLITILIMGMSTFIVGILPSYASIGVAAPVILVALRLLQGLALGGEYGGAATYVAEHAPKGQRATYTSWIQTTATLGLLLSLAVIWCTRTYLGEDAFSQWGWRLPFLLSIFLLGVSVFIRLSMSESPAFEQMKAQGKMSKAPLSESFGKWKNLRVVLIALFGLVAGQAVVWYTGQFYVLFFLTSVLKVNGPTADVYVGLGLLLAAPFFVIFGRLSDRVGRKPIIIAGLLLAAFTYFPLFELLTRAANPELAQAQARTRIVVVATEGDCSFQGNPVAREIDFYRSCDVAKRFLAQSAVGYENEVNPAGGNARVLIGDKVIESPAVVVAHRRFTDASARAVHAFKDEVTAALKAAGYPDEAKPEKIDSPVVVLVLALLVIYVAMVYAPIAAMLVELFPTRIRYTSMSLPYHVGNGWFGGLMPTIAFAMVAQNGNIFHGLWYPVLIAAASLVVGVLLVPETRDVDIYRND